MSKVTVNRKILQLGLNDLLMTPVHIRNSLFVVPGTKLTTPEGRFVDLFNKHFKVKQTISSWKDGMLIMRTEAHDRAYISLLGRG